VRRPARRCARARSRDLPRENVSWMTWISCGATLMPSKIGSPALAEKAGAADDPGYTRAGPAACRSESIGSMRAVTDAHTECGTDSDKASETELAKAWSLDRCTTLQFCGGKKLHDHVIRTGIRKRLCRSSYLRRRVGRVSDRRAQQASVQRLLPPRSIHSYLHDILLPREVTTLVGLVRTALLAVL
jgi:hypothetical protein